MSTRADRLLEQSRLAYEHLRDGDRPGAHNILSYLLYEFGAHPDNDDGRTYVAPAREEHDPADVQMRAMEREEEDSPFEPGTTVLMTEEGIRAELARAVEANEVAERALQNTFPEDMQALCDVNCREITQQATKLMSDAEHLRHCCRKIKAPGIKRRYEAIAERMEHRAREIERLVTTPDLTAFRKRLQGRAAHREQQAALERRAEVAEARVRELEREQTGAAA